MTDTEKKALALVNEACKSDFKDLGSTYRNNLLDALLHAIEQHEADIADLQAEYDEVCNLFEAYKQDVSDAVAGFDEYGTEAAWERLSRFIIPKPDPLVEAMHACGVDRFESWADQLRSAMLARGYEFTKIGEKAGD